MFRRLRSLLRRLARLATFAFSGLVVPIGTPRPMGTCTIADFIASNRTACGWTAA